ncbi:MAG: methylmalonyl-CoA mutase family protein [Bacillota bacterium]|nr:methylmalonyl-CoA mutase family protein [Bacillota bacterium]MDI7249584.1 methylmalonyl-CoA mutase family protein [Bacillota bacterium]
MTDGLAEARKRWEDTVLGPVLTRYPERQPEFTTISGLPLERLYTPEHVGDLDYLRDTGFPGEYPFTRGVQPTMYRGRLWTMRQYAGFGSALETNRRFHYLLEQGQTGLSVAFDLPTQVGYDSDHPMAQGEVGRVGVAIDSVEDMETLFRGIPLGRVSTSMTINAPAAVLLAMYQAVAEEQGVDPARLQGTVQNDILKEYVARGTYIFPPGPSLRLVTDVIEYCSQRLPEWNSISISGYHMREAGCTAVQEVAFTLANAICYVGAARERGLEVDAFARRLSFFFNCHIDFLEEIAKFRAARRLWARIMKERFGARDPRSMMLRFHTQTAGCSLTAQQPENNVVRVALQALAAVLGGTQSLHTNSMDEALALPSEKAVRVALRTQQIIAYESGVASTIDPLAGSYCLESLTRRIEEEADAYIRKIDDMGGSVRAIERGYIQKEIHEAAYRYQMEVERKERLVVGVNAFEEPEEPPSGLLAVDPAVAEQQRAALERLRAERDGDACRRALENLERAARGTGNLVPPILEAVRARCTLGEICDTLRGVFGEYRAPGEM